MASRLSQKSEASTPEADPSKSRSPQGHHYSTPQGRARPGCEPAPAEPRLLTPGAAVHPGAGLDAAVLQAKPDAPTPGLLLACAPAQHT